MPSHKLPRDPAPYDRLTELLKMRDHSVADLALAMGLGRAAVYRTLSKKSGLESYWVRIAEWLNISLEWLLAGKPGAAPTEFVDTSVMAAFSDTETITSGRIIGTISEKPNGLWPSPHMESYFAGRGRWGLRLEVAIAPLLNPGDVLVLDPPMEVHTGDSTGNINNGDFVAAQGKDGEITVGRVLLDSRRDWYVVTSLTGKTTVWTQADIHKIYRITGVEFKPRIETTAEDLPLTKMLPEKQLGQK